MEAMLRVRQLGFSRNMLRPIETVPELSGVEVQSLQTNLIPGRRIITERVAEHSQATVQKSSLPNPNDALTSGVRVYSLEDYGSAVGILQEMMVGEEKFSDPDEALLCLSLIEKQATTAASVAGFFEMVRDVDPNRTRTYRRHIIKEFMTYFPDKPIAKMVTEALSQEWKHAERTVRSHTVTENTSRKPVDETEDILALTVFNRTFYKWNNFFRSLHRKREGSVDTNKFRKLNKLKDAFYAHALIYLLQGGETAENDYKTELGNIYMQFRYEFKPLLELPHREDIPEQVWTEAAFFFKCVLFGLMMNEVLIHYVNILKLEGPSAQSLCPDKKKFIVGHLRRFQKTLQESNLTENPFLLNLMNMEFDASNFRECTYNRNEVSVRYVDFFMDKRCVFNFNGKTDNISAIKCTRE